MSRDNDYALSDLDRDILNQALRATDIPPPSASSNGTQSDISSRGVSTGPVDEALLNRFVASSGEMPGTIELLPQRHRITHDQVMRRRMGFSTLTSTEEFRATYRDFEKALASVSEGTASVPHLPFDDVVVDTPARVIQRAIDREVEQYRAILDTKPEFSKKKRAVSYEMLPDLGASVPSVVDLEEPMADIKRERYHAFLTKPLPAHRNMFTPESVLQDAQELEEMSITYAKTHAESMATGIISPPLDEATGTNVGHEATALSHSRPRSRSRPGSQQRAHSPAAHADVPADTSASPLSQRALLPHYMSAPAPPGPSAPLPRDQVLLRAIVYDATGTHKLHEVLLLPQHPLTVLRDLIRCPLDLADAFDNVMQLPIDICHARYQRPPQRQPQQQQPQEEEGQHGSHPLVAKTTCCVHGVRYGEALDAVQSGQLVPPAPPRQYRHGPWRDEAAYLSELRMALRGRPMVPPCLSLPHPSGFFFIEDVFYDDMRAPTAIRLSDSIVAWCAQKKRHLHTHLGPYTQQYMEDTTFAQLRLRLGSHYLYQHQGECKHTVVFTEMRVLTRGDVADARMYPLMLYSRGTRQHRCGVCKYMWADWITYNDKLAPESPAFFCKHCFDGLHRDERGNLLYRDFSVFPILPMANVSRSNYVVVHT